MAPLNERSMKYIIMCGGTYQQWEIPRQLQKIHGEMIVSRTIRLLRENGASDIAISTNIPVFKRLGVPVLEHNNDFKVYAPWKTSGYWCDAFYPTDEPTCYLFGDVVFSPEAIKTIVETETDDIQFFASAPPFAEGYIKNWAEPFALKAVNTEHLKHAIDLTKQYQDRGMFKRKPIMWELWQVIKDTPLNRIDYNNYVVINDYTCDVDDEGDIARLEDAVMRYGK